MQIMLSPTDDFTRAVRKALSDAEDASTLIIPKGEYSVKGDYAEERFFSISNHGHGLRRVCFLLENRKNFTLDLSGSILYLDDVVIPFACIGCENVVIRNCTVISRMSLSAEGILVEVNREDFTFRQTAGSPLYTESGALWAGTAHGVCDRIYRINEWDAVTGYMTDEYCDLPVGDYTFEQVDFQPPVDSTSASLPETSASLPEMSASLPETSADAVRTSGGVSSVTAAAAEAAGKTENAVQTAENAVQTAENAVQTAENAVYFRAARLKGQHRKMKVGNFISLQQYERRSCTVFLSDCRNTSLESVTVHSGIGMGLIAQNCENIDVSDMTVSPENGHCFSINADATHFVHCRGNIHIRDSHFEGQLDDALNVHGIYLRIADKTESGVILRYMHPEALGIDVVRVGDVLESCDSLSLLPKKRYTVTKVEKLNLECIAVDFAEPADDILIGDDMNEVSKICNVLFENCVVKNNRARGMLLAGNGKITVRSNLFDNPGAPIKLESDGRYWFESGGVNDVLIDGNTFVHCGYVRYCWGSTGLIDVQKRQAIEENRYFHRSVRVENNRFIDCHRPLVSINNTAYFSFRNNTLENCSDCDNIIEHVGKADILLTAASESGTKLGETV